MVLVSASGTEKQFILEYGSVGYSHYIAYLLISTVTSVAKDNNVTPHDRPLHLQCITKQ